MLQPYISVTRRTIPEIWKNMISNYYTPRNEVVGAYKTAYRTTFRLLRTKITIDLLFPCKQIILCMQLTLLVTGKNE
jgi:hypothetical protein